MSRTERLVRWRLGRRGVAGVELACVLPALLLLTFGLIDLVLHMRASYRTERMAGEILNAIAQLDPVTRTGVNAVLAAAPLIAGTGIAVTDTPRNDGAIHVTAIGRNAQTNANQRLWTVASYTPLPPAVVSRLNVSAPSLPGGAVVPTDMQLLAVEVLTQRTRWTSRITQGLSASTEPSVLYAIAVARPRTANLTGTLAP
jgi:Flp pilus assembly protein TadG